MFMNILLLRSFDVVIHGNLVRTDSYSDTDTDFELKSNLTRVTHGLLTDDLPMK